MRMFWKIRNHMRASRSFVARGWSYPLNLPVSFLNTVIPPPHLMMGTRSENYVLCKSCCTHTNLDAIAVHLGRVG